MEKYSFKNGTIECNNKSMTRLFKDERDMENLLSYSCENIRDIFFSKISNCSASEGMMHLTIKF